MTGMLLLSRLPIAGILMIALLHAIVAHEEDIGAVLDAEFIGALSELSEEVLDTVLEEGWHAEQTKRDQVVFFAWHEGYHMGMIGAQRKAMGYPGPAERIMAVRAESSESAEG